MPSSFDIVTESPVTVEQIHAAYSRKDYWLARIEPGPALTTLDSLTVEDDGTVEVHVTQHVGRRLLPGPVGRLVPTELKMMHSETWRPAGGAGRGHFRGHVRVSTSPKLGSGHVDAWLEPAGEGSQLRCALKVQVKIPLLGGRLEKSIGHSLTSSGIPEMQRFTANWIAEYA